MACQAAASWGEQWVATKLSRRAAGGLPVQAFLLLLHLPGFRLKHEPSSLALSPSLTDMHGYARKDRRITMQAKGYMAAHPMHAQGT